MAAVVDRFEFKRLVLKATPRVGSAEESKENSFWRKFKFPIVSKEAGAVTSIHFSPTEPHDFAVSAGSKVQLYSSVTNEVRKSLSRFQEVAYSGHFRHDGQLLVAGSEGGVVKVFDCGSRAILRQFKGHAKAVKTVHFLPDGLRVLSGSDDTSVRNWDLATGACVTTLRGHEDYVRRVVCIPSSCDLVLSGSYDHKLRLWDLRTGTGVWECDHGHPVETLLVFPSGGMGVSAGGNVVRVWDLLRGERGRPLISVSNHQKTVTSLAFDGSCRRLLSAGLDKQLKVYSVEDYRVIHNMSYPAPVLSLAMSPTDSHLVVGMTNRLLSIKQRPVKSGEEPALVSDSRLLSSQLRPGTHRYFVRGKHYQPANDEYFVAQTKKQSVPQHERFLRRFEYREALNSVLKLSL
jgi:U3 small nucleolar RNA-associated protein 15